MDVSNAPARHHLKFVTRFCRPPVCSPNSVAGPCFSKFHQRWSPSSSPFTLPPSPPHNSLFHFPDPISPLLFSYHPPPSSVPLFNSTCLFPFRLSFHLHYAHYAQTSLQLSLLHHVLRLSCFLPLFSVHIIIVHTATPTCVSCPAAVFKMTSLIYVFHGSQVSASTGVSAASAGLIG